MQTLLYEFSAGLLYWLVMNARKKPILRPGAVYRTRDIGRWGANASRTAKRLVAEGLLVPLRHGLYVHPKHGRFGAVPPDDGELMRAFVGGPFVFTGPDRWNALDLGSTATFAHPLVYNTKRSGLFEIGGRSFRLRRVAFPRKPTPEWFAVDLLEHADQVGMDRQDLSGGLARAISDGRLDREQLRKMASRFGGVRTLALVESAIGASAG
jgi:hypothetical protein